MCNHIDILNLNMEHGSVEYTKCKNCGGKIETTVSKCPYCWIADPVYKENAAQYFMFVGIGVFVMVIGFGLFTGKSDTPEDKQQAALQAKEKKADDKRRGFHCLSGWDGANLDVVKQVKRQLKDPDSFEHTETRISPMDDTGAHNLIMTYRAKNSFGAVTMGLATASVRNASCAAEIVSIS